MNLKIMKQKTVAIFIVGKAISMLGSNIQQFALSLYVYTVTGSATIFATMLAVSILPRLIFSPFAGVFGDWFDRKKMIIRLDFINAALIALYAYYFFTTQSLAIYLVYILVILLEITELFYESSSAGIAPSIVKKEEMLHLKSLMSMVISAARMLSPMIGAFLFGMFGILIVLIINAISFLLAAIMEMFMNVPKLHKQTSERSAVSFLTDLKEGFSIIRNNRTIFSIISLGTVVNFIIGPLFSVGFIVIIMDVLSASEFQFGIFHSIVALAMVIGPIFVASIAKRLDIQHICMYGFIGVAILIMLIAIVPSSIFRELFNSNLIPYLVLMGLTFIVGFIASIINVSLATLFAQVVPVEAMGRTSTVMNFMVALFIPIGQIIYGVLFDHVIATYVVVGSGVVLLVAVLIFKNMLLSSVEKPQEESMMKESDLVHEV